MHSLPRITLEVPVLGIGAGASDYEHLGSYVNALRRQQGVRWQLVERRA